MSAQASTSPVIHLIGSVPLDQAETVFRRISAEFGPYLRRLPDGETGRRASWIGFIQQLLGDHPAFEADTRRPPFQFKQWDGKLIREFHLYTFKEGVNPETVAFETGYADDAIRSFALFERLQQEGVIPPGVKYQACSGTPLAITYMYISPDARAAFQPIYTRHLLDEISRLDDVIPHDQLAYQWDVAPEVLMWEGVFKQPDTYKTDILDSLGAIGNAVPGTIELGYHLCYGSPRDEHVVQPRDLAVSVEIANGILERVERPVQFIHMPVPQDRNDDAFFQPLANLSLPEGTDLYLGCVHRGDDAGNAVKLDKARAYAHVAGISSECGWGRSDPANLDAILAAHKTLAQHIQPD